MGCFADLLQVLNLVALVTEEDPPRLSLDVYMSKSELTASQTNSSDSSFLYDNSDFFSFKLGPKVKEDRFPIFGKAWRTPSSPDFLREKEKKQEDEKYKEDIVREEEAEKKKKTKKKIMGSVGIVGQIAKAFKALGKNAKKKTGAYDYDYSGSNSFELGHLALENPRKSGEETQLPPKANTKRQPEAKKKSRVFSSDAIELDIMELENLGKSGEETELPPKANASKQPEATEKSIVASYDAASDSDSDWFEFDVQELEAALSRRRSDQSKGAGQGNEREDSSSSEKTKEGSPVEVSVDREKLTSPAERFTVHEKTWGNDGNSLPLGEIYLDSASMGEEAKQRRALDYSTDEADDESSIESIARSVRDMKLIQEDKTRLLFKSSESPLLVPPTSARTCSNLNGFIERPSHEEKTRLLFQSSESPLLVPLTSARICSNPNGFIEHPSRKDHHENIARQKDAIYLESATATEMSSANSSHVDGLYHDDEDSGADCNSRVPSQDEYILFFFLLGIKVVQTIINSEN